MCNRRLRRALFLLALVCVTIAAGIAIADEEAAPKMATYRIIVGTSNQPLLPHAISGDYTALVTEE